MRAFNVAVYWKRQYRQKGPKEPWYILTNLPTLKPSSRCLSMQVGHRTTVQRLQNGGYHLEGTKVNETRFLALVLLIAIAYSWATLQGQWMKQLSIEIYAGRLQEHKDKTPQHSAFGLGLYRQRWRYGMEVWADWALNLIALKPHKHLYFQRGFYALSLIQQTS